MKIGIDLGGTKTEGILLDEFGNTLERKRFNNDKDYTSSIKNITSLVKNFENKEIEIIRKIIGW